MMHRHGSSVANYINILKCRNFIKMVTRLSYNRTYSILIFIGASLNELHILAWLHCTVYVC